MERPSTTANNNAVRRRIFFLFLVVVLVAGGAIAYWWLFKRNRVSTDNAYVMADSARVSSRIPGTVFRILVENDQYVSAGEPLVELDDRDYRVAVQEAEGTLARIEAEIEAIRTGIDLVDRQTRAQVQAARAALQQARDRQRETLHRIDELEKRQLAAEADLQQAQRDYRRISKLFARGAVSKEQRDRVQTALVKAEAQVEAIKAELRAAAANLKAVEQAIKQARAQLRRVRSERLQVEVQQQQLKAMAGRRQAAAAALERARLNLSYCTITAPITGYVAQKSVQVGERVQPGQPLLAVVPLERVYVEANFKETQLEDVRLGQPVLIEADAYPDFTYKGRVAGIRAGTGASFSLLPPENATGNWIKVVQRVPVKIILEQPPPPERPLLVGLSLQVTIDTSDRSGPVLLSAAAKP